MLQKKYFKWMLFNNNQIILKNMSRFPQKKEAAGINYILKYIQIYIFKNTVFY